MRRRIEPMKKFARTLREHRQLLLNYFKARKEFSSGVVEGLNNKAKSLHEMINFVLFAFWNSRCITHLPSCPARAHPQMFLTTLIATSN
jgi:hypothetical protein